MKVGIVILNYKTAETTCELAKKFDAFEKTSDIVIVDNFSDDNSCEYIQYFLSKNNLKKTTFLKSDINGGYAKGNNLGLKYLVENKQCEVCFIVNPDIIISDKDFSVLVNAFEINKEYAVLTCKREYANGMPIRQYWSLPTVRELFTECFVITRVLTKKYKKEVKEEYTLDIYTVDCVPGAFWGVRSDVLKELDYLDEGTFLYYEEICFATKIRNAGYKEGLVTNSKYVTDNKKSSTVKVRKNGKGFEYLVDSKIFFVEKYINRPFIKQVLKIGLIVSKKEYKMLLGIRNIVGGIK